MEDIQIPYTEIPNQEPKEISNNGTTTYSMLKRILTIGFPITLSGIIKEGAYITNAIILGHISDDSAPAATLISSLQKTTWYCCSSLMFFLFTAAAESNKPETKKEIGCIAQAGWLQAAFCSLPQFVVFSYAKPLLILMNQEPNLAQQAADFLNVYRWSLPILCL